MALEKISLVTISFFSGILSQWWKMSFGKFQRALGFHAGWNSNHPGRRVQSEERTGNLEGAWLPRRGPWTLSALGGLWRWHFVPSVLSPVHTAGLYREPACRWGYLLFLLLLDCCGDLCSHWRCSVNVQINVNFCHVNTYGNYLVF